MKLINLLLMSLALSLSIKPASAHPHVFIESTTQILMDKTHNVIGFRHKWSFDAQYTAFAIVGLDTNKDGVYSKEELEPLAKENIESLSEFDYFTFANQKGKTQPLNPPTDYTLIYENNVLTLEFTLKLKTPTKILANPLTFSVYDPEFFIAFLESKLKGSIELASSAPKNCMFEKKLAQMDQTSVVESRLGQAPDLTNEENKGAGSFFAPSFIVSCLQTNPK